MKVKVGEVFRAYFQVRNEREKNVIASAHGETPDSSYGELLVDSIALYRFLEECEVEVEVPQEVEHVFTEHAVLTQQEEMVRFLQDAIIAE